MVYQPSRTTKGEDGLVAVSPSFPVFLFPRIFLRCFPFVFIVLPKFPGQQRWKQHFLGIIGSGSHRPIVTKNDQQSSKHLYQSGRKIRIICRCAPRDKTNFIICGDDRSCGERCMSRWLRMCPIECLHLTHYVSITDID